MAERTRKKELLSKESVELVDYHCEFIESSDGWADDYSLEDEEDYTISDLKEIPMSVSEDVPDDLNNKLEAENTENEGDDDLCERNCWRVFTIL